MSHDLTIKGSDTFARTTPKAALEAFVARLPGVKRNGGSGFVLDDPPKRRMEIDLEWVNEEGDNIEVDGEAYLEINCIRMHIPYSFLGDSIEVDYLPTAFAIADFTGWSLHDDQSGEPVPRNEAGPQATETRAPASIDRAKLVGHWVSFPYSFCNTRQEYGIFEDGRFEATVVDDFGGFVGSANGTWEVMGDVIQWSYEACKNLPRPRRPQLDKVLRLEDKRFAILEGSGNESEFWREVERKEVSGTFSPAAIRPFLERLVKLIPGGFAGREIDSFVDKAKRLEPKQSSQLAFRITFEDTVSPFIIRGLLAEAGTLALFIAGPIKLAQKIGEEIRKQP